MLSPSLTYEGPIWERFTLTIEPFLSNNGVCNPHGGFEGKKRFRNQASGSANSREDRIRQGCMRMAALSAGLVYAHIHICACRGVCLHAKVPRALRVVWSIPHKATGLNHFLWNFDTSIGWTSLHPKQKREREWQRDELGVAVTLGQSTKL